MTNEPTPPSADDPRAPESLPKPFDREERYIVIKRKYLSAIQETAIRAHMARLAIRTVECVVVESDWPEYETVWQMIESRCALASPTPQVEPVAWEWRVAGTEDWIRFEAYPASWHKRTDIECRPLYTHPTPLQQLQALGLIESRCALASPTPQVEPVAWMYWSESQRHVFLERQTIANGFTETPLTSLQQLQALGQEMYGEAKLNLGSDTRPTIEAAEPDHSMSVFETGGEGEVVADTIIRAADIAMAASYYCAGVFGSSKAAEITRLTEMHERGGCDPLCLLFSRHRLATQPKVGGEATSCKICNSTGHVMRVGSVTQADHLIDCPSCKGFRLATLQPADKDGEKLRVAWWNDMRERGVSQDVAIAKISAALGQPL